MSRTSRFAVHGLAAGLMLAASGAAAAELGSLSYPPQAVFPFGGASFSSVVNLPKQDVGIVGFFMNIVLPPDYSANAKVGINVYFTTPSAKPCNMVFRPQTLARYRPGVAPSTFSAGLEAADGSDLVAFSDNTVVKKVFTIRRDPAFPGGQRAGDAFRVGLGREGAETTDTCGGTAQIPAIDIRYPRAP